MSLRPASNSESPSLIYSEPSILFSISLAYGKALNAPASFILSTLTRACIFSSYIIKLLVAKPTYLFTSAKSICFNGTCFIAAMFWCWVSTNLIKLGKSLWEPPIIVISFRYGLVTVSINWFYSYLLGFRFYSPTVDPARLTAPLRG